MQASEEEIKMCEIKIFFSEWTDSELKTRPFCHCDCHQYPGVYATPESDPCHVCGHVHAWGYFPSYRHQGWVEYWRSDKFVSPSIYAD